MHKKIFKIGITIIVLLFSIFIAQTFIENKKLKDELSIKNMNEKALLDINNEISNENRVLHIDIENLKYINDSTISELNKVRKDIGIKDKQIEEMSYVLSQGTKTDTLMLRDTIFRDREFVLDTTLGDKWISSKLHLEYPGKIGIETNYISELNIFSSIKKETVNPPKECAFLRWFQKKQKVLTVEVIDNNPHAKIKKQKHIKIIKK